MGVHINGDEIIEFHGQLPEAAKDGERRAPSRWSERPLWPASLTTWLGPKK
jgi:hypothetical protein